MTLTRRRILIGAGILLAVPAGIFAQTASPPRGRAISQAPSVGVIRSLPLEHQTFPTACFAPLVASPLQPLLDFKDSDIKFNLLTLMTTLRDNRHEGWVLAAYPDPKTSRPLIGAGFSLDVPAREHVQRDPLNPNRFLEPSSAELWQAAGLEPQRLRTMLVQYDRELSAWKKKRFRRKIRTHSLFPEIGEEDATKLLRISAIQAVHNAKAYCRNFDQLTAPQQMALTQLVFQMGVNLEEFTQFLAAINGPPAYSAPAEGIAGAAGAGASFDMRGSAAAATASFDNEYWKTVRETLIHSDWARRYRTRAVSVIAMFDPSYESAPWDAEAKVRAEVRPLVLHRHRRRAATVRTANASHRKTSARRTRKS